jgi:PTS system mannose-specific IIA component
MIGVIVATHGDYGTSLLSTLRMILGESPALLSVPLQPEDSLESFRTKIEKALSLVDPQGSGTFVLVDMLGGTPFNVAIPFAAQGKVRVITGVNLPMLVKVLSHREETDLDQLCSEVREAAREGIVSSVDLLKPKNI